MNGPIAQLEPPLRALGIDLFSTFDVATYNERVARKPVSPLPSFGRGGALGVVIGNTRAMWPWFLAAHRARRALQKTSDPLDAFVADAVTNAVREIDTPSEIRWSTDAGARLVSMLDLAEVSGLARRGPAHLAVHAEHGPWFALRAAVVFDLEAPAAISAPPDPCRSCSAPCVPAMQRALDATQVPDAAAIATSWRRWVAVRDACPVGRGSRYSDDQIQYHYLKKRELLA